MMSPILIILVEDDVNLRLSFTLILQRAGYLVTATDCIYKAMEAIRSRRYNLVISDTNVPESNTVLLPMLLDVYSYLSVVVLTDHSSSKSADGERLLSNHYLVKPLAPELLLDHVRKLVGSPINPALKLNNGDNLGDRDTDEKWRNFDR